MSNIMHFQVRAVDLPEEREPEVKIVVASGEDAMKAMRRVRRENQAVLNALSK